MTTHTDPIGRALGTRLHPQTDEVLHRDTQPHVYISRDGAEIVADVPGWYPDNGSEAMHTPDDDKVKTLAAAALKAMEHGFERRPMQQGRIADPRLLPPPAAFDLTPLETKTR